MPWPALSNSCVRRMAVFGSYHWWADARSSSSIAKWLPSSPGCSRALNTGSPSKRGRQHHTMRAWLSISALMAQLPIITRLSEPAWGSLAAVFIVRAPRSCVQKTASLIGDVVSHKDWGAPGKGGLCHEIENGLAFVDAPGLHFKDTFTAQQFHTLHLLHGAHEGVVAQPFQVGGLAVVQGHARALGLYQQPRIVCRQVVRSPQNVLQVWRQNGRVGCVGQSVLGTMLAGQRQVQRGQKSVDVGLGPPGHDGQRAVQVGVQR